MLSLTGKISFTCIALFHFTFLFSQPVKENSHFDKSLIPPAVDYSLPSSWAALPNRHDYADSVPPGLYDQQQNAEVDVFFIHPTIYTRNIDGKFTWNADVNNVYLNNKLDRSAILYQASIFNGSCKIYAPRYRQAHYYTFVTKDSSDCFQALGVAYEDVRAAFEYYLKYYNNGRPIVIASHSQGTMHAVYLLREFFLNKPLEKKLVVAYLVGHPIEPEFLAGIRPCKDSADVDCYATWNTFKKNYIPYYYNNGLNKVVCTNPLSWTLDENYMNAKRSKGALIRPFNKIRPNLCDAQVHKGVLWITKPSFRGSILYRSPIYHIGDYNLFYMDVRDNVALRVKEYLKLNPGAVNATGK